MLLLLADYKKELTMRSKKFA